MTAATVPPAFHCDVIPERDRVRVAPVGELDLLTAPQLERTVRELLASGFDHVVLDLAELRFLDSTGLHLILSLRASADAAGHRLELRPGPPPVQRVFELTGTLDRARFEAPTRPLERIWIRR
jgi:anti-sigma B factor antagonist